MIFRQNYRILWASRIRWKSKYVYIPTGVKLALCIIFDTFFVSTLSISASLGVNGIGYSNIVVKLLLFIVSVILLSKEGYSIFTKEKLSFKWILITKRLKIEFLCDRIFIVMLTQKKNAVKIVRLFDCSIVRLFDCSGYFK